MLDIHNNLSSMQRAIAIGVAGLALTASPALARPDYPVPHMSPPQAADLGSSVDLRSPDAADAGASASSIDLRSPDAADTGTPAARLTSSLAGTTSSSPQAASTAQPAKAVAKADSGLDWGSVGIGAGIAVGVGLLGLAGVALTQRARMHAAR
jgi:hypothetical protein